MVDSKDSSIKRFFVPLVSDSQIRKEKQKARELRKTRWWQKKCAPGICYYCGKKVGAQNLTMDHVVPLIRGGKSVKSNLVPACKKCNQEKKYLLAMEWEKFINPQNK